MTVSVKEVKTFLRVDHDEDDTLIRSYIYAAESLCLDIMRTDDRTMLKSEKMQKWLYCMLLPISMNTVKKLITRL